MRFTASPSGELLPLLPSLEKHNVETITDETREDTIQALEQLVSRASNMLEQLRS